MVAVAHRGETDERLAALCEEITWIRVGELQTMIDAFKRAGVTEAAMAGGIARARLGESFAPDARAIAMLARVGRFSDDALAARGRGRSRGRRDRDDRSGAACSTTRSRGRGRMAGPEPSAAQLKDLRLAFGVMRALGSFDVGQAAAVRDGVVGAIEAVEGTDAALRRAAALCGRGLVVAKAAKPGQDLRFDRPAIGPATIELLSEIGAAMIGVEAGQALILERARTLAAAASAGITDGGWRGTRRRTERGTWRRSTMDEIRVAVIGAGRLGALHALKYTALAGVRLTHVVDVDPVRARETGERYGAAALADYHELKGKVTAASVAAPGSLHHEIASYLLAHGIDVLLEKPMAASVHEARELAALAERSGRVLQIGHLERFNPAIVELRPMVRGPRFIECLRVAPFTERGTDVDVILDLMVHDLDVILTLTAAEVATVEAIGVAVLTEQVDVANARLRFSDGLIANLNTSRVAPRRERKIRLFQPDAYLSVDYEARRIQVYRKSPPPPGGTYPEISAQQIDLGEGDPLGDEIAAFADSVRTRRAPAVTALDGLRVMEVSERIRDAMRTETGTTG